MPHPWSIIGHRTCLLPAAICFCGAMVLTFAVAPAVRPDDTAVTAFTDAAPITFADAAGETVRLPEPPRRMAVVGQAPYILMHMLYMFPGAGFRLAGYEQKVKGLEDFVRIVDPENKNSAALQPNPGPEQIAALKPDLVLMKSHTPGPLEKPLGRIGIPVVHLDVETPQQFLHTVDLLGLLLGNPRRAAEIRAYYQSCLDRVAATTRGLTNDQKPRVLFMKYGDRTGDTAMQVPGSLWIQTQQTQLAGGRPVWLDRYPVGQNWQVVGFEQIALWNPDTIIMVVWYRLQSRTVLRQLSRDDKWKQLKALTDRRFYLMPEDIFSWDSPDPRWILGLLWMTARLHPQRFGPWDMKAEVSKFFRELYGMAPSAIDTHIIKRIALHGCP